MPRHSLATPLPTTAQAMRALPSAVVDLHLDRYHLSHAGSRSTRAQLSMAQRLWDHTHPADSTDSTGSDTSIPQDSREDGGSTTSHSPVTSAADSSGTEDNSIPYTCDSRSHTDPGTPRDATTVPGTRPGAIAAPPAPAPTNLAHEQDHALGPHVAGIGPTASVRTSTGITGTVTISGVTPITPMYQFQNPCNGGEFIEFTELSGELTVIGGAGIHSHTKKHRVAPIASLQSWLQAFSTFSEVLSSASPSIAQQLWRYQSFIIRSSQRFQPHAWLQYNLQFRRKLASDPTCLWSSIDTELVASCLSADTVRPQVICFSCGAANHMATECPNSQLSGSTCTICRESGHISKTCPLLSVGLQKKPNLGSTAGPSQARPLPPRRSSQNMSFRPAERHPAPTFSSTTQPFLEPCLLYNRNGFCRFEPRCRRRHACIQCQGSHPMRDCPQQSR